jgi:hypothetical protein
VARNSSKPQRAANRYERILEHIFASKYAPGDTQVQFERQDLKDACVALGIQQPDNLGDVIYSFRHRNELPSSITAKAPTGQAWIITSRGRSKYQFEAASASRVTPSVNRIVTKVPDATPEIIRVNTLGDEQALLATVRYNRLVDTFLGLTTYSLQTHWRTTAKGVGQLEVDEVYVAVDRNGTQFIVPVQAKTGSDQIGIVQISQDLKACAEKYPQLVARPVAAQFLRNGVIAMFELTLQDGEIVVVHEEHYKLVGAEEISDTDRATYARRSSVELP